jgi:hypothetical protein
MSAYIFGRVPMDTWALNVSTAHGYWEATPRRTVLCFWLWLADVPGPERGASRRRRQRHSE